MSKVSLCAIVQRTCRTVELINVCNAGSTPGGGNHLQGRQRFDPTVRVLTFWLCSTSTLLYFRSLAARHLLSHLSFPSTGAICILT